VTVSGPGPFTYQWQQNGTNLPDNIINTVAGGGTVYPGDGGPATNADLISVVDVAVDTSGDFFFVDQTSNRIHKVAGNGMMSLVAGSGANGFSGDGLAATNADLSHPSGVAVDSTGNLFITDSGNSRIRKVGTNGIIRTVAGNGSAGYGGDGGPATNASLDLVTTFLSSGVVLLPILLTTASARSAPMELFQPSRGKAESLLPVTAARPPMPIWPIRRPWPSMAAETFSWQTP
jgi:hypothetical protein